MSRESVISRVIVPGAEALAVTGNPLVAQDPNLLNVNAIPSHLLTPVPTVARIMDDEFGGGGQKMEPFFTGDYTLDTVPPLWKPASDKVIAATRAIRPTSPDNVSVVSVHTGMIEDVVYGPAVGIVDNPGGGFLRLASRDGNTSVMTAYNVPLVRDLDLVNPDGTVTPERRSVLAAVELTAEAQERFTAQIKSGNIHVKLTSQDLKHAIETAVMREGMTAEDYLTATEGVTDPNELSRIAAAFLESVDVFNSPISPDNTVTFTSFPSKFQKTATPVPGEEPITGSGPQEVVIKNGGAKFFLASDAPPIAPTPAPSENKVPTQPTTVPTAEAPAAPVKEPSTQPGETDYSKLGQEELKKIVDNAQRMWSRGQPHTIESALPLSIHPEVINTNGSQTYYIDGIVAGGANNQEIVVPGLVKEFEGEQSEYTIQIATIPIILQDPQSGEYYTAKAVISLNDQVSVSESVNHELDITGHGDPKNPSEVIPQIKEGVQTRFETQVLNDAANQFYINYIKNRSGSMTAEELQRIKERVALVRFLHDSNVKALNEGGGQNDQPLIGPIAIIRLNP